MRVPLGWLRDYVDLPARPQEVAEMLAQIGFPVDAVEQRPKITGVVAGRIEALEKHPNADRLQVGKINVGNGKLLTIATAATNVAAGQTIGVATIGAQLPQLRIEPRKMRGIESEGMMISADELALPPEWFEDGIMQLDGNVPLGADLVDAFGLSDAVLDVEVTSNRVDAMSMIGIARELAAYTGASLRLPPLDYPARPDDRPVRITLESPDCKRYVAQRFTDIRIAEAPAWMRVRLALAGQRPISNVVDISNYVMLETGQPLHFYDESKIAGRHIIVRDAHTGEELTTLDGTDHELTAQALVIADDRGALGLAGLKGGQSSEIGDATTSMILEAANFTGARVRRMSAQLGLRTDAGTRHEKALPPALTDFAARRAAHLLCGQGAVAHEPLAAGEPLRDADPIVFQTRDVKRLLGFDLTAEEIREMLDRLGFGATPNGEGSLRIVPPAWRRDVTASADVVEEIARMAGYDRIESVIPSIAPHSVQSTAYELESRVAHTLVALGYREIMTYALVGAQSFERVERAGIDMGVQPAEVLNPLSEDQRFLRTSIAPSMLEYLARLDAPAKVFEIGHVFNDAKGQPGERAAVTFAMTVASSGEPPWRDSSFLRIKGDAQALVAVLTGCGDVEAVPDERPLLHPGKTAALLAAGKEVASVGCLDPRLQNAFDLRFAAYLATIYFEDILEYRTPRFAPPSKYPSTYRDLALLCNPETPAAEIERAIAHAIGSLCTGVRAFDEYRGPQIAAEKKSLAVRVTMQRFDATITDEEADRAIESALGALGRDLGATLRT